MQNDLITYRAEVEAELHAILGYWSQYTIDEKCGGFFGRITNDNIVVENAPKGSVLNCRILWAFSAGYRMTGKKEYLENATRAYKYFIEHFTDQEYGGVYWTVDYAGKPLETKKQIYAQAFAVYGLSEYYLASQTIGAMQKAIEIYKALVKHSYDKNSGGYWEAFSRDWSSIKDLRLSDKDENAPKTMNTHLHVLEAFTNLYRSWPDAALKKQITGLVQLFLDHIIDANTGHLLLFFNEQFQSQSAGISYGHDIEAAWLLQEAAEVVGEIELTESVKKYALRLAEATVEGLDRDGGLWYELDPVHNALVKEKHSWPQAEAMVGFMNAFQISGDEYWLNHSLRSWNFIQRNIVDKVQGEWFWGVEEDLSPMKDMDKVGLWKCPYHSSRACIEIMKRAGDALSKSNEKNLTPGKKYKI